MRHHNALHRHAPLQALRFIHIIPKGTAANRSLFTCIACTLGCGLRKLLFLVLSVVFMHSHPATAKKNPDVLKNIEASGSFAPMFYGQTVIC